MRRCSGGHLEGPSILRSWLPIEQVSRLKHVRRLLFKGAVKRQGIAFDFRLCTRSLHLVWEEEEEEEERTHSPVYVLPRITATPATGKHRVKGFLMRKRVCFLEAPA